MDCWLVGWLLGWIAGWVTELLCLLGLLGLLEGMFGFLALLGGGLNHVVSHARRSERSADNLQAHRLERKMDDGWLLLVGMEDKKNVLQHARRSGEVGGLIDHHWLLAHGWVASLGSRAPAPTHPLPGIGRLVRSLGTRGLMYSLQCKCSPFSFAYPVSLGCHLGLGA